MKCIFLLRRFDFVGVGGDISCKLMQNLRLLNFKKFDMTDNRILKPGASFAKKCGAAAELIVFAQDEFNPIKPVPGKSNLYYLKG